MKFYSTTLLLLMALICFGQKEVRLWKGKPPGSKYSAHIKEKRITGDDGIIRIQNVTDPTLTIYPAMGTSENSPAIIVCPGGGYKILAWNHEGTNVAEWLAKNGITALVLKYRLPASSIMENKSLGPLEDLIQALTLAHSNAEEWKIDPDKIGVMGFSAGGHLAASGSTLLIENNKLNPDFSILLYPVITMNEPYTHTGSRINLIGLNPPEDLLKTFSLENQVSEKTPPTFIVHADDDEGVMVENSLAYYKELRMNGVSTEIYIPNKGGHGFGLKGDWKDICLSWLKRQNIL